MLSLSSSHQIRGTAAEWGVRSRVIRGATIGEVAVLRYKMPGPDPGIPAIGPYRVRVSTRLTARAGNATA
eukprot:766616-Hanusia_phi.AAC.5